jgi:hypothetical protein
MRALQTLGPDEDDTGVTPVVPRETSLCGIVDRPQSEEAPSGEEVER